MKKEIKIVVESRRVPTRVVQMRFNTFNPGAGLITGSTTQLAVMYDYILDNKQIHVLNEARRLAHVSGASLQVVDLRRENGIRRAIRRFFRGISSVPLVTIAGLQPGELLPTHPSHAVAPSPHQQSSNI